MAPILPLISIAWGMANVARYLPRKIISQETLSNFCRPGGNVDYAAAFHGWYWPGLFGSLLYITIEIRLRQAWPKFTWEIRRKNQMLSFIYSCIRVSVPEHSARAFWAAYMTFSRALFFINRAHKKHAYKLFIYTSIGCFAGTLRNRLAQELTLARRIDKHGEKLSDSACQNI